MEGSEDIIPIMVQVVSKQRPTIRVGFVGSMRIGMSCLRRIADYPHAVIAGASVPENRWWDDVSDPNVLLELGIPRMSVDEVFATRPDIVFSIMNSTIFTSSHIDVPQLGIINLHPAPLPRWRGVKSIPLSIIEGETRFGSTFHYVSEEIDAGHVIEQLEFDVDEDETGLSLFEKTMQSAESMFELLLPRLMEAALSDARLPAVPQNTSDARYFGRRSLTDGNLNGLDGGERQTWIRAFTFPPHEPAFDIRRDGVRDYWTYDRSSATIQSVDATGFTSAEPVLPPTRSSTT